MIGIGVPLNCTFTSTANTEPPALQPVCTWGLRPPKRLVSFRSDLSGFWTGPQLAAVWMSTLGQPKAPMCSHPKTRNTTSNQN